MKRSIFITFEGGEGSGKTTQLPLAAEWLAGRGHEVVTTREPGGTKLGTEIRKLLLRSGGEYPVARAELLLYAADRAQHVEKIIRPALGEGKIVLCDRYADATVAYQGHGRQLDLALIAQLNEIATGGLRPDATLWFDIDPAIGVARSLKRLEGHGGEAESRFEEEEIAFHTRVREGYEAVSALEPARVRRIDAGGTIENVAERVRAALSALLSSDRE